MGLVSESDSKILGKLARECRDPKERERLRALFILSIGHSGSDVSKMFFIDEDTICSGTRKETCSDSERSGRQPSLGNREKDETKHLIEENGPGKHGINLSTWTCTKLRLYFGRKGIAVSEDAIRHRLKEMAAHSVKTTL